MSESMLSLVNNYKVIALKIAENGGEIPSDLEPLFDNLALSIQEKAQNYAIVIQEIEDLAISYKRLADEFSSRAKALEARKENLRSTLKTAMLATGNEVIETDYYKISLRTSNPKLIVDEDSLPAKYFQVKQTFATDTQKVKDDLAKGVHVPGATLETSHALFIKPMLKVTK